MHRRPLACSTTRALIALTGVTIAGVAWAQNPPPVPVEEEPPKELDSGVIIPPAPRQMVTQVVPVSVAGANVRGGPTCYDEALNGDESDVDCGGSMCARCDTGLGCRIGSDCLSGLCV